MINLDILLLNYNVFLSYYNIKIYVLIIIFFSYMNYDVLYLFVDVVRKFLGWGYFFLG